MDEIIVSGGITEPLSAEALAHAKVYYEEIRHRTDDIKKIAEYLGVTEYEIVKVKNYLFNDIHVLSTGIKRFDPSFEIAETWRRLSDDQEHVQPLDKLLIPHELREMELVDQGIPQGEAHDKACAHYDYPRESTEFYNQLKLEPSARIGHGRIISGGIDYYLDEKELIPQRKREEWQRIM